jgi:adenylate kinase family enzyme
MSTSPPPGRRISIRGTSGSGKSTLGKALAKKLEVPFIELDSINHQPNWQEIELGEFRRRVSEIVVQEGWVIDGNYGKVGDLVLDRCDTVVWLDYPLPIVLWRLTRRIFRRGILREELWNGNREKLWKHFFTRDSLYWWVLSTNRRRKQQAREFFSGPQREGKICVWLRHPREADKWLNSFGR